MHEGHCPQLHRLASEASCDVHLNDVIYWDGVPSRVWSYSVERLPFLKKWPSYRETDILCHDLLPTEAREVTAIVRRIAALLLLAPQLDANYRASITATIRLEESSP